MKPWEKYEPGPWQKYQEPPATDSVVGRTTGLTGRWLAEGIADLGVPFANGIAVAANQVLKAAGVDYQFPEQGQAFSDLLTSYGAPVPETGIEKGVNFVGRVGTGMAAGGFIPKGVSAMAPKAPPGFPTAGKVAATKAGQILQKEGIPLDRSQATDIKILQRFRSMLKDNPVTTGKQQAFEATQQKAFNKAVLKTIGEDASEATQSVMARARERIGSVFNKIGQKGSNYDDALKENIAAIVEDAKATVPDTELRPFMKNVDDLIAAVKDGKINGDIFIKIRSRLGKLAKSPMVGESARDLQQAMVDALERTYPGQKAALQKASEQWRSLRIVENAISKTTERDISPLRLSNAIATKAQRNMSVYGYGGNQDLVDLAQAGREVLPEVLPQSGTAPRSKTLLSAGQGLLMKPGQRYLLSQPGMRPPPNLTPVVPFASALTPRK